MIRHGFEPRTQYKTYMVYLGAHVYNEAYRVNSEYMFIWPYRLSVRTFGFQPKKSGSTPGGATVMFGNYSD